MKDGGGMAIWIIDEKGQWQYSGGKKDWAQAAEIAAGCPCFAPDHEDEQTAEEEISCYNCRFRRWTASTFICMKG